MSRRLRAWRWRLARWVAPMPIMSDPFPGVEKGALIQVRDGGTRANFLASELNLSLNNDLVPLTFNPTAPLFPGLGHRRRGTFSGTIGDDSAAPPRTTAPQPGPSATTPTPSGRWSPLPAASSDARSARTGEGVE